MDNLQKQDFSLFVLNVMLFEMRAERISCARHITLDWIAINPF